VTQGGWQGNWWQDSHGKWHGQWTPAPRATHRAAASEAPADAFEGSIDFMTPPETGKQAQLSSAAGLESPVPRPGAAVSESAADQVSTSAQPPAAAQRAGTTATHTDAGGSVLPNVEGAYQWHGLQDGWRGDWRYTDGHWQGGWTPQSAQDPGHAGSALAAVPQNLAAVSSATGVSAPAAGPAPSLPDERTTPGYGAGNLSAAQQGEPGSQQLTGAPAPGAPMTDVWQHQSAQSQQGMYGTPVAQQAAAPPEAASAQAAPTMQPS